VERGDYRIIARTRASDVSSTRALARSPRLDSSRARVATQSIREAANASAHDPRFAHIFLASPRISSVRANAIARVGGAPLRRAEERAKQQHRPRHTYQIETARMLSAIEFFLGAVIIFLSLRRCDRRLNRANRAETQVIRRAIRLEAQRPSRFLSASLTACGLAFPPVDFITCPTNQPNMPGFILACSALSGLAAITASTALSIAPKSVT
jgi:hypothetical protein